MDNNDAEKIIIAHLLRFPEMVFEITERLQPEDFSSPRMRALFQACLEHSSKGYNLISLTSTLKGWGWDLSISECVGLQEWAYEGIDLERVKDEIKIEAQKRSLAHCLKFNLQEIEKPGSDLTAIHEDLSQKLLNLQAGISTDSILKKPSDFRESLLDPQHSRSIQTGINSLDSIMGGLRPNELTVGTGETGSGKTTFMAAFLPYILAQKGYPVLIASFEMKPEAIQRKLVQMTIGRPFTELNYSEKEKGIEYIESLPINFVDVYGQVGLRELRGAVFKARKQFDVNLVVLDHLHFFLKYTADHERQAIDAALVEIKSWAMTLGLHIILIVHPTKIETENRPIRMNDLRGSASLKQVPDNILSIWRPRGEDFKKPQNEIILEVLKVRDDAGDEGKVILTFDKRSQSYSDSGPDLARSAEGRKGSGLSSPSSRPPERHWLNGYDT